MTDERTADVLLLEQRGAVRWLRLNRPHRRNALTPELIHALDRALTDAATDTQTSVIVLAGDGPSFCAGADLRLLLQHAQAGSSPMPFLASVSACCTRIEQLQKPVIAAVHGHVVAGGLELALSCDIVVAQSGTLIGDGHVRNGLLPAGGSSVRLPRKVGEPLARWLLLTGELLPAERFVPSGFVHCVADPARFEDTVNDIARSLAAADRATQTTLKQLLEQQRAAPASIGLDLELDAFRRHWNETPIADALHRFVARNTHG